MEAQPAPRCVLLPAAVLDRRVLLVNQHVLHLSQRLSRRRSAAEAENAFGLRRELQGSSPRPAPKVTLACATSLRASFIAPQRNSSQLAGWSALVSQPRWPGMHFLEASGARQSLVKVHRRPAHKLFNLKGLRDMCETTMDPRLPRPPCPPPSRLVRLVCLLLFLRLANCAHKNRDLLTPGSKIYDAVCKIGQPCRWAAQPRRGKFV